MSEDENEDEDQEDEDEEDEADKVSISDLPEEDDVPSLSTGGVWSGRLRAC